MRERRRGTAIGLGLFLTGILIFSPGRGFAQSDGQDQPPPQKDKPDKPKSSHDDKGRKDDRGGGHAGVGLSIDVASLVRRTIHGKHLTSPIMLYRVEEPIDPRGNDYKPTGRMFAALQFHGDGLVGYFNLSVDGDWVVQNMPVIAKRDGAPESEWFGFALDRPHERGDDSVGYSVSADVSDAPPSETMHMAVAPKQFFFCGAGGGPSGGDGKAGGGELVGGPVIGKAHVHTGAFPNQDSLINQCVSAAFSNSLQWMNTTHTLGLDPKKISPAGLDGIVGRDVKKEKPVDYKQAFTKKQGAFAASIDTYWVDPADIQTIGDAIDNKCDVEMFTSPKDGGVGHAVAVTGISKVRAKDKDGHNVGLKWKIDIVEDLKQGPANAKHDPQSEGVIYPTGDKQIDGGGVNGRQIAAFVVECKKGTPSSGKWSGSPPSD